MLEALLKEFRSSIKSPDTEEKLDLALYRPLGFAIAKMSVFLMITPSMLSLLGLFSGILASYYFLDFTNKISLTMASLLFVLSGIFDSADGQLARIANLSSKLGLILDGICDSLVIIAIYAVCSWPFIKSHGPLFILVVALGIYLHSCQCAILDFYHREYLYFGYGKTTDDTYWNPDYEGGEQIVKESSDTIEKGMNQLRLTWIKKQQLLTTRKVSERKMMRDIILHSDSDKKKKFTEAYKKNNLWLLPLWRLIGVNAHTALMILFMFIGRFDLYIIAFDIIVLNVIILIVGALQKKADEQFFLDLKDI